MQQTVFTKYTASCPELTLSCSPNCLQNEFTLRNGINQQVVDHLRVAFCGNSTVGSGDSFLLRPALPIPGSNQVSVRVEEGGDPRNATVEEAFNITPHLQKLVLKEWFTRLGYDLTWKKVFLWQLRL